MNDLLLTPFRVSEFTKLIKDTTKEAFQEYLESLRQNPPPAEKTERLLTTKEAEIILGVSYVTLYHWANKGLITKYKIGRLNKYKESELLASLSKINKKK
jgi:excisionase family DNA binding protein